MRIMSCQAAVYPINTTDANTVIQRMLDNFDWEGLEVEIGPMSTFIRGEETHVWRKIRELYQAAAASNSCVLNLTLSNSCGINM